jgi:2-oxoglutarate/2-oxoacid ferredoxin oxidoreductase subunit beta
MTPITAQDYESALLPAWCPGCGNFGILEAFKRAMVALQIEPHNLLMCSGIGQAGKLPHYTRGNIFNGLHGRAMPPAVGAKIVNPALTVIVIGGDGDGYGEGGNHTIHAMRRNHDLTYMVHDNQVYGLTKGQASPTSDEGYVSKTTPHGASPPVDPIALGITMGATFVARGFSGDIEFLSQLIVEGVKHKGFSLIDILQPCVTFNHINTLAWYAKRVYKLDASYDPSDRAAAMEKALEWGERIPTGIIYRVEGVPSYEEKVELTSREPIVKAVLRADAAAGLATEFI